jgi:RNase H-fold protein (predicted Holliday junction resolvase)
MTARPSLSNYQAAQVAVSSPVAESKSSTKRTKTTQSEELIQTSFRLPRSKWKKLQELSIDERRSVQAILVAALEAEFSKRGLSF